MPSRLSVLRDAAMRSEFRLKDAQEEADKGWDAEVGAKDTLEAEKVTLEALKASYELEKQRVIASIKSAPADSEELHPTLKQMWFVAAADPETFGDLSNWGFMPKALFQKYRWVRKMEKIIAKHGSAYIAINNCLGITVAEVVEEYKAFSAGEPTKGRVTLVSPGGTRTPILFDFKAKELTFWDEDQDDGFLFNGTAFDTIEVCVPGEDTPVAKYRWKAGGGFCKIVEPEDVWAEVAWDC